MVTMYDYSAASITRIVDNTCSTTSSTYSDLNITRTDVTYTYANSSHSNWHKEIDIEIIKKLIKRQIIQDMKAGWSKFILEKPIPKLRPLSLRGVCFGGRGWA